MTETLTIDEYSVSAFLMQMRYREQHLSVGTAFTFKFDGQIFLITNWHNVSGKNPRTGECLSATAAQPDNLIAVMLADGGRLSWKNQIFKLVDEQDEVLWYEHPIHHHNIALVALPISCGIGVVTYPINEMASSSNMSVHIGQDVFVLGFPFGLMPTGAAPMRLEYTPRNLVAGPRVRAMAPSSVGY